MKCPKCGRFVANVSAVVSGPDHEILSVGGRCRRCGPVVLTDWDYEDFFPPRSQRREDAHD